MLAKTWDYGRTQPQELAEFDLINLEWYFSVANHGKTHWYEILIYQLNGTAHVLSFCSRSGSNRYFLLLSPWACSEGNDLLELLTTKHNKNWTENEI